MDIEKNIPMPDISEMQSGEVRSTLLRMEVGDSVLFCDGNTSNSKSYATARQVGFRNGLKFSGRSVEGCKCRVWRIK